VIAEFEAKNWVKFNYWCSVGGTLECRVERTSPLDALFIPCAKNPHLLENSTSGSFVLGSAIFILEIIAAQFRKSKSGFSTKVSAAPKKINNIDSLIAHISGWWQGELIPVNVYVMSFT
jgi:hypothetical protein